MVFRCVIDSTSEIKLSSRLDVVYQTVEVSVGWFKCLSLAQVSPSCSLVMLVVCVWFSCDYLDLAWC